jgi:peptidoglycan/LPS O-acetylase OafA/YrhL
MNAPTRVHAIDWLRAMAVLGVMVYHVTSVFDTSGFTVKNAEQSAALSQVVLLFETFGLALLFLLAGAATRFALDRQSPGGFLRSRAARLLIPYVVGTLLFTPLTLYLDQAEPGQPSPPLLDFLASVPAGAVAWASAIGMSPAVLTIGYHLWFLAWLFCYSALALPLLLWLRGARGRSAVDRLARALSFPGASLLMVLPLGLPPMLLLPLAPDEYDWWRFAWYGLYFLAGYLLWTDARLTARVRADLLPAAIVAVPAVAGLYLADFRGWTAAHEGVAYAYDGALLLHGGLYVLAGWSVTILALNLGMRVAAFARPIPAAIGRAVMPAYVIHHPTVILAAFFVVQWPMPMLPKALLLLLVELVATALLVRGALSVPVVARLLVGRPPAGRVEPPVLHRGSNRVPSPRIEAPVHTAATERR